MYTTFKTSITVVVRNTNWPLLKSGRIAIDLEVKSY